MGEEDRHGGGCGADSGGQGTLDREGGGEAEGGGEGEAAEQCLRHGVPVIWADLLQPYPQDVPGRGAFSPFCAAGRIILAAACDRNRDSRTSSQPPLEMDFASRPGRSRQGTISRDE